MPDPDARRAKLARFITVANEQIKVRLPREIGQAAAELHDEMGYSWPQIAAMTGVPMATLYRRARPYIEVRERSTPEE